MIGGKSDFESLIIKFRIVVVSTSFLLFAPLNKFEDSLSDQVKKYQNKMYKKWRSGELVVATGTKDGEKILDILMVQMG